MDTHKISKLLRLMKLLTGNVSRTIDQLAKEMGITPRTSRSSKAKNSSTISASTTSGIFRNYCLSPIRGSLFDTSMIVSFKMKKILFPLIALLFLCTSCIGLLGFEEEPNEADAFVGTYSISASANVVWGRASFIC